MKKNQKGGREQTDFGEKYLKSNVYELKGYDFNGTNIINKAFKNKFGFLKVYAPWCPHCTNMVDDMKYLATELKKENIVFGALNSENPKNSKKLQELDVGYFPSLYMVYDDGKTEKVEMNNNSVEGILDVICNKSNGYVNNSKSINKKGKCCKKEGNTIKC